MYLSKFLTQELPAVLVSLSSLLRLVLAYSKNVCTSLNTSIYVTWIQKKKIKAKKKVDEV